MSCPERRNKATNRATQTDKIITDSMVIFEREERCFHAVESKEKKSPDATFMLPVFLSKTRCSGSLNYIQFTLSKNQLHADDSEDLVPHK